MKRKKAMRIFEALSGVDEELLVRSEESASGKGSMLTVWSFHKVLAACFCLIVVGAMTWGALRVMPKSNKSANDTAAPRSMEELGEEIANDAAAGQSPMSNGSGNEGGMAPEQSNQELAKENVGNEEQVKNEEQAKDARGDVTNSLAEHRLSSTAPESLSEEIDGNKDKIVDTESCLTDNRENISEEEARATDILGAYLPTALPAGYTVESARREKNSDASAAAKYVSLSVTWTKGMDSIFLTVKKVEPSHIVFADLSKPECYNVHLYDIPYGETVPEEYRETFDNPVFRAEDLSLELIEMRMKSVADSGDTDTPRGDFSVLYGNDILVKFNGDGSAEQIWEMFQSVTEP